MGAPNGELFDALLLSECHQEFAMSMVRISWEGSISGTLVLSGAKTDSFSRVDELAVLLSSPSADFTEHHLRLLGNCAFFFALREASGNDPLLPAADRVIGSVALEPANAVNSRAFKAGSQELREMVFAIRGSSPSEILTAAHDHLLSVLEE